MYVIASASRAHASSSMWSVLNSAPRAADKAFQHVMKALTPAVGSTVRPGDADQGKLLREHFAARKIVKCCTTRRLVRSPVAPKMTSAQGSAGLASRRGGHSIRRAADGVRIGNLSSMTALSSGACGCFDCRAG